MDYLGLLPSHAKFNLYPAPVWRLIGSPFIPIPPHPGVLTIMDLLYGAGGGGGRRRHPKRKSRELKEKQSFTRITQVKRAFTI